jgi:hypothetical protein
MGSHPENTSQGIGGGIMNPDPLTVVHHGTPFTGERVQVFRLPVQVSEEDDVQGIGRADEALHTFD